MNALIKYSGFLAVLCLIDGAFAAQDYRRPAQGRVSVAAAPTGGAVAAAMRARIPTLTKTGTVTTTTTTTTSSLLAQQECIEKYTECIQDSNACGSGFEECTTTALFYTKKPQCNNVLLQCGADGINALFGASNTTLFADKDSDGNLLYPTAGSILGQFIEAGHIANLLDKTQCVKRVTSCLKKENVCGETFELCTSNAEFKKQKVFCESTIARCQSDGVLELFGVSDTTANPTTTSRLGVMISEGADLAAVNAVATCYKVADQCILSTCSANPYKCITDSAINIADITDAINAGTNVTEEKAQAASDARSAAMVNSFIRGACMDTVGGNKYCHMTVNGGRIPSAAQLIDEDSRDEVYSDIYASRMNPAMRSKIQEFADKFDKKTKDKCSETIMSCAMRSCGSGLGSLCYKKVFSTGSSSDDFKNSINGDNTYEEIKRGCASIVNTDANCQYAAAVGGNQGLYSYAYNAGGTFDVLFPTAGLDDPLGVVERLNAALSANYNDAAIAQLAKQCRATAVGCIKSMCGSDYTNCYRNRTDVMSDTYNTDNAAFDHSMNKVGGVLDFNIIRGLCIETIKNANTCDEHLKIQSVRYMGTEKGAQGWGTGTVRDAWNGAVSSGYKQSKEYTEKVLIGCQVGTSSTSEVCKAKRGNINMVEDCGYVDEDGCVYDTEYYQNETDYAFSMASDTLFQEVLGDIEKEAQAKYNAKLTKEQNMCVGGNNGGLMGARDMSSTYMWVKLKSKRIPKNYSTAGLKVNDFTASNDLYGSFCRARVTIQSDDPNIQKALQQKNQNWSTAYFAVGDVFTCGSWIPQEKLEEIAKYASGQVEGTELYERNERQKEKDERNSNWIAAAAALAGGTGVGLLTNTLQSSNLLGGLLNKNVNTSSQSKQNKSKANSCVTVANEIIRLSDASTEAKLAKQKARRLENLANNIKDRNGGAVNGLIIKLPNCDGNSDHFDECIAEAHAAKDLCQEVIDNDGEVETDSKQDNTRRWISIGTGAAAGVGTFFLVRKAIRDSKEDSRTEEQNKAYDKFMREVGDHIYCFIGAEEAGNYGDLVEISVE